MTPYDEQPERLGTTTNNIELRGLPRPSRWRQRATGVAVAAVLAASTTASSC